MFEYFADNYVWSLSTVAALNTGGLIDEVDRACRPLREAAAADHDAGTEAFFDSWSDVAEGLAARAAHDEAAGRARSARQKYARAAVYLALAERMQSVHWEPRRRAYARVLELFAKGVAGGNCERVEVPYGDTSLPAYFVAAAGVDGPAPCIVQWNGLDSTKEMMHQAGLADELATRGISTLLVDTPGSGEALRLRGLTAVAETESWATACVDHLQRRPDVDGARIGIVGWSLGGYYAPRAAAFEKRLRLCVAWGANHNWGEMQKRRLRREGEHPVPHYWDHVMWVWGAQDIDQFMAIAERVSLVGVLEELTVPFLITHGANDRQIPLEYAEQSYAEAVNSPRRELKVFSERDGGGAEHIGVDNLPLLVGYIADWIDETFAALSSTTAPAGAGRALSP